LGKIQSNQGGVKVHVQLNLKTAISEFIQITPASVHEVNILDNITFQPDSFYLADRGYHGIERINGIEK